MRIVLFMVLMGVLGFIALAMLPEPHGIDTDVEQSSLPVEQVNTDVRNVTPENTLPGPIVEKTVISRLPSLVIPPLPKPKQKPVIWRNLIVSAAGILKMDSSVIHIQGIKPLALDAICSMEDGGHWPCGRFARTAMRGLVRSHRVKCKIESSTKIYAKCSAGTRDIGEWLVRQGWAKDHDGKYIDAMKAAKHAKNGMWRRKAPRLN